MLENGLMRPVSWDEQIVRRVGMVRGVRPVALEQSGSRTALETFD